MIQIVNKKKFFLMILTIAAIIAGIIWGIIWFKNRNNPEKQPQVYEALVNIVDQKSSDPVEDARFSLKKNDVIAVFPEGHSWSDTEKNSYLIVKLKITPEEMAKLTQSKTRLVKVEPSADQDSALKGEKQEETILAREYKLDLPDYDAQKFWENHEQPFEGKIFTNSLIKKK